MSMTSLDQIRLAVQKQMMLLVAKDQEQQEACLKTLEFMEKVDNPFTRRNLSGHITASAWTVNLDFTKALLIRHPTLGKWLQPGGHVEMGEFPGESAIREGWEETGLEMLYIESPGLFDIDVHRIPENPVKQEPEHTHYDLRYLVVSETEDLSGVQGEVHELQWVNLDMIVNLPEKFEPSIVRMAMKTLNHPNHEPSTA